MAQSSRRLPQGHRPHPVSGWRTVTFCYGLKNRAAPSFWACRAGVPPLARRCECAPIRRSTVPGTARRHTQVPPYEHGRTAPRGLRAGTSSDTVRHKAAVHHPLWGGDGDLRAYALGIAPVATGAWGRWSVSPAAAGGCFAPCAARPGRCPWTPRFFEKIE